MDLTIFSIKIDISLLKRGPRNYLNDIEVAYWNYSLYIYLHMYVGPISNRFDKKKLHLDYLLEQRRRIRHSLKKLMTISAHTHMYKGKNCSFYSYT